MTVSDIKIFASDGNEKPYDNERFELLQVYVSTMLIFCSQMECVIFTNGNFIMLILVHMATIITQRTLANLQPCTRRVLLYSYIQTEMINTFSLILRKAFRKNFLLVKQTGHTTIKEDRPSEV